MVVPFFTIVQKKLLKKKKKKMQYTVKNDTPFQILTSAIVIGPSQTGYQLEVAADGKNFSPLFTVGANVTRQATNLSSGAYYRLNGNVGDVIVNWVRSCVTPGGSGGSGTELSPVTEFPLNADPGTVVALASGDTYGIYQYDGTNWNEAGADVDLSAYWTSAQTQSAITIVEDHLYDVEEVTASALTELHEGLMEVSGRSVSTEEIELPIAAAVNELKGNIEARLDQQYYKKAEVDNIAARKAELGQVNVLIQDYVDPAIAEVNDTIEDKELPVSAALNKLNEDIATIDEVIPAAIVDINDRMVSSSNVKTIWRGTQAEYDAITTKDASTLYIIL